MSVLAMSVVFSWEIVNVLHACGAEPTYCQATKEETALLC